MKRATRVLCLVAAIAMIFTNNALAVDAITDSSLPENAPVGVLTSSDGTTYFIQGEVIDAGAVQAAGIANDTTSSITYGYDVVLPRASGSLESDPEYDSSVSLKAYVTVYWLEKSVDSFTGVLFTHASVRWSLVDNVIVNSASIYAESTGSGLVGYDNTVHETKTFNNVTNGTKYATNFTQYVQRGGLMPIVGAQATFDLSHGSSSNWTFTTSIMEVPT